MRKLLVAGFVIAAMLAGAGWYYLWGPCGTLRVRAAVEAMRSTIAKWDDLSRLAGSTARIALSGPVGDLQKQKQEAETLDIPTCLFLAHRHLVLAMDWELKGYLAFMRDADYAAGREFRAARSNRGKLWATVKEVEACMPLCL